ncbi:RNA polymerase sigma factor [Paenibacillus chitinolyticus]|uniref:RNA polymerase sigma factor n=1 Tax=Paenibacillus chitinolyticus TaxID=79263 RepID=UPI001C44B90D|nr:RNA polymerase sigma factor [Paenibacillus chitinolyticus]MBV6715757.1 RNA polymerase sigma factor [Paenibacillus chitinolyticus]
MEITEHGGSKRGTGQPDKGEIREMSPVYAVPGLFVRRREMTPVPDQGPPEPEAPEEHELIDRARRGDQEAFNELVRRHRAQALGLANRLVEDHSLAEDVVQDALIRAFLHLGTLADAGKFGPWLRRIVRNQALLKLRRGGPFGRERPFSSLPAPSAVRHSSASAGAGWDDVDAILFRLENAAAVEARHRADPAESLMRKAMLEGLRSLLHGLSPRERGIFEAHFFGELPPAEIARLLGTATANVYNSLSRSRAKVRRERIRVSLQDYVRKRAQLGLPARHILAPPP